MGRHRDWRELRTGTRETYLFRTVPQGNASHIAQRRSEAPPPDEFSREQHERNAAGTPCGARIGVIRFPGGPKLKAPTAATGRHRTRSDPPCRLSPLSQRRDAPAPRSAILFIRRESVVRERGPGASDCPPPRSDPVDRMGFAIPRPSCLWSIIFLLVYLRLPHGLADGDVRAVVGPSSRQSAPPPAPLRCGAAPPILRWTARWRSA